MASHSPQAWSLLDFHIEPGLDHVVELGLHYWLAGVYLRALVCWEQTPDPPNINQRGRIQIDSRRGVNCWSSKLTWNEADQHVLVPGFIGTKRSKKEEDGCYMPKHWNKHFKSNSKYSLLYKANQISVSNHLNPSDDVTLLESFLL